MLSDKLSSVILFSLLFAFVSYCFRWSSTTIFGVLFGLLGFYLMEKYFLSSSSFVVPDVTVFVKSFISPSQKMNATTTHVVANNFSQLRDKCKICNSRDCLRNDSTSEFEESNNYFSTKPIDCKNVRVPKIVDEALEDFLNVAFQTHVHDWYDQITDDKAFLYELRYHLRYALAFLLHRVKCVNLSEFILKKILPKSINFLNCYLTVLKETCPSDDDASSSDLECLVLERIKPHLHCAMYNRESEISYLRSLSEFLLKKSLTPQSCWSSSTIVFTRELLTFGILSPLMDIMADPDIINRVLELFFDLAEMETYDDVPLTGDVVLLEHFVDTGASQRADSSFLQVKLSEIFNNQKLFYAFMIFLKNVDGPMNWLQFLLAARELQAKMNADDASENYALLRFEFWELYKNYFHESSPDLIVDFSDSLSGEFKSAMETSDDLTLLQQILENAYKEIYSKLQQRFVAPFCQSAEFFDFISSDQDATEFAVDVCAELRNAEESNAGEQENPLAEIKRRMSDALAKTTTDDETLESADSDSRENFVALENDINERTADDYAEETAVLNSPKDLTQWNLSMPKVEPRRDPSTGRTMYVYVLIVQRSDLSVSDSPSLERDWKLDRRYHEFYVLETKLVEFHGESILGGFPLPPKKTFNTKSRAFVEGMRSIFEHFLKRLLANPQLKNSELLVGFLSSRREFTMSFLSNPLRAVKSIPAKLSFERGQHLVQFLQNLVDSVEVRPPQQQQHSQLSTSKSNASLNSLSSSSIVSEKGNVAAKKLLENSLFGNNCDSFPPAATAIDNGGDNSLDDDCSTLVGGVYDTILFLMRNVFKIPRLGFSLMVGLRVIIKESFDNYVDRYLKSKLELAAHERRTSELIRLLLETLFYDEEPARSEKDKTDRRRTAYESINLYFDVEFPYVKKIVGDEQFEAGVRLIFECLQNPRLNKQLSYTLLDCIVAELFPDLTKRVTE